MNGGRLESERAQSSQVRCPPFTVDGPRISPFSYEEPDNFFGLQLVQARLDRV